MINNNALPASVNISTSVLFQNMGDEYVLLNMETESYFGLDEVAARFWQLFSEGSAISSAVDQILSEYDIDRETVEKDLNLLLEKLESNQLLTIVK